HDEPPEPPPAQRPITPAPDVLDISNSEINEIALSQRIIRRCRNASLDDRSLSEAVVKCLRNPPTEQVAITTRGEHIAIKMYLSLSDTSIVKYNGNIELLNEEYPPQFKDDIPLSFYQVQKLVRDITGTEAIKTNMCPKSCIVYTCEFEDIEECPYCVTPRVNPATERSQTFKTILLGFVLEALCCDPSIVKDMLYLAERMPGLVAKYDANGGIAEIDDICCGEGVLCA
ncbi:hypothetical protein V5O48_009974, partial [Marasmius crinis-equi]